MVNILIADDKKFIRQGIACMLQNNDSKQYQILLCGNGQEALQMFDQNRIDLLITDIRMPEMDGIELMQRAKKRNYELQVVVVSGYDDFNYAKESIQYGVRAYLLKPICEDELLQCVSNIAYEIEAKKKATKKNNTYETVIKEIYNYEPTRKENEIRNKMNYLEKFMITIGSCDEKAIHEFVQQVDRYTKEDFFEAILLVLNRNIKSLYEIYLYTDSEKMKQLEQLELFSREEKYQEYIPCLEDFLIQLNHVMYIDKNKHCFKAELRNAIDYINKNYYKTLSLDIVANNSSLSYAYFSHSFKEYTGCSFSNYLTKVRIRSAKKMLSETNLKIYEISVAVGFQSDKHFMRTFKKVVGVSPMDYRLKSDLIKQI